MATCSIAKCPGVLPVTVNMCRCKVKQHAVGIRPGETERRLLSTVWQWSLNNNRIVRITGTGIAGLHFQANKICARVCIFVYRVPGRGTSAVAKRPESSGSCCSRHSGIGKEDFPGIYGVSSPGKT